MKKGVAIPALKAKTREAARAIIKHDDLLTEYQALLGLPEDEGQWTEYHQNVALVRDMRLDAGQRVFNLEQKIAQTPKEDKAELKSLKAQKKEVAQEILEMPELGSTYEEWEELSSFEKSTGVGRPPLAIEVAILRAEDELNASLAELRDVEAEEGVQPQTKEEIVQKYEEATKNTGRARIDPLGVLDRDIRNINQEIEYIESGEAEQDRIQKEKESMSKAGKRQGRPPIPLEQKLNDLKGKRETLLRKRNKMESNLGPIQAIERQIKLKHDDVFFLRKALREKGMDPRDVDVSGTYEGKAIESAFDDIASLKKMIETMQASEGSSSQIQARESQKILAKESERLRKRNEQIRAEAREKMGISDLDELARDVGVKVG